MSTHGTPSDEEIEREYLAQYKQRYITLENPAIDDAFGVYDYDGEMWVKEPYVSKQTAYSLATSKNLNAKRL